jgi:predicted acetyltransferase
MVGSGSREKVMELVKPSLKYKESFLEAVEEFKAEGKSMFMHDVSNEIGAGMDFEKFLERINFREQGKDLPEGRVPQTHLWLVEGSKFIGWVKIRHELNDTLMQYGGHIGYSIRPSERRKGYGTKILELGLEEAKRLGIEKVLVTCDDDNIASAKIIEKNGGVMENTSISPEGKVKRRYWIENN